MLVLTSRADFTLAEARDRLQLAPRRGRPLLMLAAAALTAITALGLAAAVILGPPSAVASVIASPSSR